MYNFSGVRKKKSIMNGQNRKFEMFQNDQKGKDGSKLNCTSLHFKSNVLLVLCLNIKIKIT